jgi:general secretion pathway protein G
VLTPSLRRRAGFTVVEMVVVIAIMAMVAAVLLPVVTGRLRDGQTTAVAQTMDALSQAIAGYRTDVRRCPTRLQHLTTPPPAGTRDPCGRLVPQAFLDEWRGPYIQTQVTAAGLRIRDATVQDTLGTDPATFTPTTTGYLLLETVDIDAQVAAALAAAFDADDDPDDGVVRVIPAAQGLVTLRFGVRIRGC